MKIIKVIVLIFTITFNLYSTEKDVYFFVEPEQDFNVRIDEAFKKAEDITAGGGKYWVGYVIDCYERQSKNSYFNGCDIKDCDNQSIEALIYRKLQDSKITEDVFRKRAILLLYGEFDRYNPEKVKILNLRQSFSSCNYPVFWTGDADDNESLIFLNNIYKNIKSTSIKPKNIIVNAIGVHESKQLVFPLLKNIIEREKNEKILKSAIFWVGNIHTKEAAFYLEGLFYELQSDKLKKSVIFSLHNIKEIQGIAALIKIAKSKNERTKIRKDAIFWLSQSAAEKSLEVLKEITIEDDEAEIRKSAVFAISQLPNKESIPALIDISKTSPYKSVRKEAVFWLSQKDDPRVIKFFEDILLNN